MMKSYIAIQSTLFNGVIDLVGYTDMQGNIRLTHTSIYAYMSRTFPQMSMEFDVRSTDVNHAVVVCRLRSKIFDGSVRTVTEIGETSASLLPDKFKGYPVQVSQEKDPVKREGLYAIQQYLALYRSRGCQ